MCIHQNIRLIIFNIQLYWSIIFPITIKYSFQKLRHLRKLTQSNYSVWRKCVNLTRLIVNLSILHVTRLIKVTAGPFCAAKTGNRRTYSFLTPRCESPRNAYRGWNLLGGLLVHSLLSNQVAGEITHNSHLILVVTINLCAQNGSSQGKRMPGVLRNSSPRNENSVSRASLSLHTPGNSERTRNSLAASGIVSLIFWNRSDLSHYLNIASLSALPCLA